MGSKRQFITLLTTLVVLGACSDSGSSNGNGADGTGSTGTTGTTTSNSTNTADACPYEDRARGDVPTVQLLPPGASSPTTLSDEQSVACGTVLSVSGGGAAGVDFGPTATCRIDQGQLGESETASIATRDPRSTLFRIGAGRALCTITAAARTVRLCGQGFLLLDDAMQVGAECKEGSLFGLTAYAGSLRAIYPNGEERAVLPGSGLLYEFDSGGFRETTENFNQSEVEVFAQQAIALGLIPLLRRSPSTSFVNGLVQSTDGEWSGAPLPEFTYQWQGSCSSLGEDAACTDIAGETGKTYTPSESDCPGVRVVVTARNQHGSNVAPSIEPFDLSIAGLCSSPTTSSTSSTSASPSV